MTAISDIYDALIARIPAQLTSHTQLEDAYDLGKNNERFLKQGWGVAIGPAAAIIREMSCHFTTQQQFTVSITREVFAREFDVSAKIAADKELMEDVHLVHKDLVKNNTLNDGIYILTYNGHNGIENVFVDTDVFRAVRLNVTVTYSELFQ